MDQHKLDIVKSTAPLLKEYSHEIGSRFYNLLFSRVPELYNVFNQTNQQRGLQQEALTYAVYAAGEHLDHLETIRPLITRVTEKHVGLGVSPDQYPIVGETFLQAVKDTLADKATNQVIDAWGEAYNTIADMFIFIEQDLYEGKGQKPGGWQGFRDFRIVKKVKETDFVTSFYLKPTDGQPVSAYEPGQYLTLKASIEGETYTHMRHYSLSDAPGKDYYRISVKRENDNEKVPNGVVSNYLHNNVQEGDVLPFAVPAGDFSIASMERPIVLISGGIGLTPLISMLNTIVETEPYRPVTYIHATQNSLSHVMKEHVDQLTSEHKNVASYVVYDSPTAEDKDDYNFDKQGYIDLEWLKTTLPDNQADFYFCGPTPFMKAVNNALKEWEVPEKFIHYESFNPISILEEKQPEPSNAF